MGECVQGRVCVSVSEGGHLKVQELEIGEHTMLEEMAGSSHAPAPVGHTAKA